MDPLSVELHEVEDVPTAEQPRLRSHWLRLTHLLETVEVLFGEGLGELARVRDESVRLASMTPREARVVELLVHGRSASEIAEIESVSIATVRSQIQSVKTRLNVQTQLELVAAAHRSWVDERGLSVMAAFHHI